jgi:multiple sugar transport system permease protein
MSMSEIFQLPPRWIPAPFAWQNYIEAVIVIPFGRYFLNSMVVVMTTLLGSVLTCSLAGFSFSRLRWRGRDTIFVVLLTSLMMPYAVTLIPTFVLWKYLGGINTFMPLVVPSWFGTGVGGVFNIFLLRQFFLTIPFELDEAAYMDGAPPLAVYWFVVMPLSTPVLVAVIVTTFGWAWNDLLSPLVYLIDSNKFTLAIGLAEFNSAYSIQWDLLMAASIIVILPVFALFFALQRFFVQGIVLTGLKG